MQRVEWAVPGGGSGMDAVLRAQCYRRGGARWAAAGGARGYFVAIDLEELQPGMERLAHQQFERSFGGFQFVAFELHLLDALE